MSELPLNPTIYHNKTQPYKDHFFEKVQPIRDNDLDRVLRQWSSRGRILLLVYPPPGDMAARALQAYTQVSPQHDTLVYVGEGRGGANADAAFFDTLEGTHKNTHDGDARAWILVKTLPVRIFGTKGYEKLYIFKQQATTRSSHEQKLK